MAGDVNPFDLVPKEGWFPQYLRYAQELTDAPDIFHIASALSVQSAAVSNWVELRYPMFKRQGDLAATAASLAQAKDGDDNIREARSPVHLWLLLIGPSGDRKSTALNMAYDLAEPLISDQRASIGTPESTFDLVSHKPDSYFFYPEGAAFFGMFWASYWKHGQGIFPELYDGRKMKRQLSGMRTKKNPNPEPITIDIPRPRVSLAIGIAPDHLDSAQATDWTGGLIGRMALIWGKRNRFDPDQLTNDKEMERLQKYLLETRGLIMGQGMIYLGLQIEAAMKHIVWSREIDALMQTKPPKAQPLFNRLPNHVRRIAAHYAISQRHLFIDSSSMEPAIRLGNYIADSVDRVVEMLADDKVVRAIVRIRTYMNENRLPYAPVIDVAKAIRMSYVAMEPALRSLTAQGEFSCIDGPGGKGEKYVKRMR